MNRLVLSLLFFAVCTLVKSQSIGLGTQSPHASAIVEMASTTKGILIPRMNTSQRTTINAPAPGLLVYDITTSSFWFRNNNAWVELIDTVNTELHRNGPEMLYMGMTDRVGIGTMTPDYTLDVRTTDENYGVAHTSDSVEVSTYVSDAYGGWIGTVTNHSFNLFANDGFGQFTLMPNGNVCIGHINANNKLDIFNTGRSGIHATGRPLYVTSDMSEGANGIEFRHSNATQGIGFGFNTIYATGSNPDQLLGLAARGLGSLLFTTNNAERMRIDPNGFVGIGTNTPHALLQFSNVVTNKKIVLHEVGNDIHQFSGFGTSANVLRYQVPSTAYSHIFYAATSSLNSNELMRISGTGQVMIGTPTPATGHLLSVGGKIAAEEVLVDLKVDWPDYVFEKEYILPSLAELRHFIADKGHLPGVPSAVDVQENGIQLGEMNAMLLEKIEELTLYILAQEERIKKLESQTISNR